MMSTKMSRTKYFAALQEHLGSEVERAVRQADWYREHSRQTKTKYLVLRTPAIIISISLPQLIVMQSTFPDVAFLPVAISVLALLAAILTSLDTFFRYGDTWVEEKAAELAIYSLLRRSLDKRLKIEFAPSSEEAIRTAERVVEEFRNEYEQIVGQTVGAFAQRAKAAAASQVGQQSSE